MKFGDKARFQITKVDGKGRGCGLVNGRPACAYFTAPGEEIEAVLAARRQGVLSFDLMNIVTPSPKRVSPRCRHAGQCGGCIWQMFDYELQLELKRGLVNDALDGAGLGRPIDKVVPCPELFDFRNRMDYCVGWRGEVGLKRPGRWNAYLDLEECHLLSPEAVEVVRRFRDWMKKNGVAPWDGRRHAGYARYVVIREGKNTGQRMVTIVTSTGDLPAETELIAALQPLATTLYHGINPTITDLSLAPELRLIYGPENLTEEVDGRKFLIPPNSFFQTNTGMAGELARTVGSFLDDGPKTILDLYCGVGFLGISVARPGRRIVGVEIDEAAVAVARRNAELNGVTDASFTAAAGESLVWQDERPDAVIIDPPRSGLHPKVARLLVERRPERLIYVSCNHNSFVRDWKILSAGFAVKELRALDLFPHGPHVELVASLTRR